MARAIHRLSPATVKNAKPGMHPDGGGLYLQATLGAAGQVNKSWLFRYAVEGKDRQMGLGALPTVTLADARRKAAGARQLRAEGRDPIDEKTHQQALERAGKAKILTFDQCADAYIKSHRPSWRNPVHAKQWETTLETYASPVLGKLAAQTVDTALVLQVLEPIWTVKPETAGRVRGRIETVLDWASARGYRAGENPARWRGHLDKLLPRRSKVKRVQHHPALPYAEIGAFMADLQTRPGIAAKALQFTILTVARTSETIGARWSELDMKARIWTVPPDRIKGGREHRVPLNDAAMAILEEMRVARDGEFVFPGGRHHGLSNAAMSAVIDRMNEDRSAQKLPRYVDPKRKSRDITVHGFRSTFRTWAAERTNFPREVAEAAIAHAIEDETEAAYNRGELLDKRRRLMAAWAEFALKPPAPAGKVVKLRSA